ncbi:hypothetical protein HOLleu_33990 [Holothuria leucospilota]|uniref:HAT C-terminal dimerisation domain-containing protein n=1 Tax=Holothuria leucospilota TaxID=206669 RepID=A0A9Q1BI90_HOLLE|nr:hypothetical protein HOLleu_33990 [Holothuria leucospilota]
MSEKNRNILKKVFNTAYMILKCKLPFTLFPNMLKLQIKNGSDIDGLSSYRTNTACRRFTQYIVDDIREPLKDAINNARVFSVIYDGATDASVTEVEIVYCRYVRDGKPLNCFVNLHEVEHAHAEGVFSAIDNAMVSAGIENWKEKLVGTGSDGAKVNVGISNSVATRMQGDGRHYQDIVDCTIDHISNRLSNSRDKARPVLEAARIFDVRDWPTTRTDLSPYGNQELDTLLQQLLPVLSRMGFDQSELKKEWIQLKAHVGNLLMRHPNRNQAPSLSTFFLTDDYRKKFHNILMLVEIVFVLPMSSAVCERGFSAVNRIKSD